MLLNYLKKLVQCAVRTEPVSLLFPDSAEFHRSEWPESGDNSLIVFEYLTFRAIS